MNLQEERKNWENIVELTKALRKRGYREISYKRLGDGYIRLYVKTWDFDVFDARRFEKTMKALDINNRLWWSVDCGDYEGLKIRVKMGVFND